MAYRANSRLTGQGRPTDRLGLLSQSVSVLNYPYWFGLVLSLSLVFIVLFPSIS